MFYLLLGIACSSQQKTMADPKVIGLGRELFQQHVSAIGGRSALQAHSSLTIHGRLRNISDPLEHRFITWKKAPGQIQTQIEITGIGTVERGYDGEVGWEQTAADLKRMPGDVAEMQKRKADFYFDLNDGLWYPNITSVEEAEFAGRPCLVVQTVNSFGQREDVYFEKESGLKMGTSRFVEEGDEPTWVRYGHYVLIEDIRMPLSIEETSGDSKKLILLQEVRWDSVEKTIKAPSGMPE
jgi:hypothetical protein